MTLSFSWGGHPISHFGTLSDRFLYWGGKRKTVKIVPGKTKKSGKNIELQPGIEEILR